MQELGFSAFSLKQVIEQIDKGFGVFRGILAGIGGVALLVAAIGIANTMLVTVAERRAEVGLKLALGAPREVVLVEFLLIRRFSRAPRLVLTVATSTMTGLLFVGAWLVRASVA